MARDTDFDGNYTLRGNKGEMVLFTGVGFKKYEVKVHGFKCGTDSDQTSLRKVVVKQERQNVANTDRCRKGIRHEKLGNARTSNENVTQGNVIETANPCSQVKMLLDLFIRE